MSSDHNEATFPSRESLAIATRHSFAARTGGNSNPGLSSTVEVIP